MNNKFSIIIKKAKILLQILVLVILCLFGSPCTLFSVQPVEETIIAVDSPQNAYSRTFSITGGEFYELNCTLDISSEDIGNESPLATLFLQFNDGIRTLPLTETLINNQTAIFKNTGYKYIYSDGGKAGNNRIEFRTQFRTPSNAKKLAVLIQKWKNRGEFEILSVQLIKNQAPVSQTINKTPYHWRLSLDPADSNVEISGCLKSATGEIPPLKKVLLLHSFKNEMAEECPPLQKFPRSPEFGYFSYVECDSGGRFSFILQKPQDAKTLEIGLCTFYYDQELELSDFVFRANPDVIPINSKLQKRIYNVIPESILQISGSVDYQEFFKAPHKTFMTITFYDEKHQKIALEEKIAHSEEYGDYIYLPSEHSTNPFKFRIKVPARATKVELGFKTFRPAQKHVFRLFEVHCTVPSFHAKFKKIVGNVEDDAYRRILKHYLTPDEYEYLRSASPKADMFMPLGKSLCCDEEFYAQTTGGKIKLKKFPVFTVPAKLTWEEDPFHHGTWLLEYHSLYWMLFFHRELEPAQAWEIHKKLLLSYFDRNFFLRRYNTMAWNDHAVASRLETLLALFNGINREYNPLRYYTVSLPSFRNYLLADEEFFQRYAAEILTEAHFLENFLQTRVLGIHNHNLFVAHALIAFADTFPELACSKSFRNTALQTILEHIQEMYEMDGVTREQASTYQNSFLEFFYDLYVYFGRNPQYVHTREILEKKLEKILQAQLALLTPNRKDVRMGDYGQIATIYDNVLDILSQLNPSSDNSMLNYFRKNGQNPTGVTVFKESGLYIFRTETPQPTLLFIDLSINQKVHGHFDLGSWQFYRGNKCLVGDPGGPYKYGSFYERYFRSSTQHNLVSPAGINQMPGVASDVRLEEQDQYWSLSFSTNVYGAAFRHRRKFLILKDLSALAVIDTFQTTDGRAVVFESKTNPFDLTEPPQQIDTGFLCVWPDQEKLQVVTPLTPVQASLEKGFVTNGANHIEESVFMVFRSTPQPAIRFPVYYATSSESLELLKRIEEEEAAPDGRNPFP